MAKNRKLRTEGFFNNKPAAKLPSPDEVNKTIAKVTGKEEELEQRPPKVVQQKRVPLTTAITPENRAKLEVASIHSKSSVADLLNNALEHYFEHVIDIEDQDLVNTFIGIYGRKAKT